jgi:hypothetical protein
MFNKTLKNIPEREGLGRSCNHFREQVRDMGIWEVLSAPRSPWQRAYVERVIGSYVVLNIPRIAG